MAVISLSGFSMYLKMHLDHADFIVMKRSHWQVPHASNSLIFYTMHYQMHVGKQ